MELGPHASTFRRSRGVQLPALVGLTWSLSSVACTALVVDAPAGPSASLEADGDPIGDGSGGGSDSARPCDPAVKSFAPARVWQLTDEQYVNVVRDVFDIALSGSDAHIVSSAEPEQYTNYSEGVLVGLQVVPSYQVAAQRVGALVQADAERIVGSARPSPDELESFLRDKVARAFRRPLSDEEVAALSKLYEDALPEADVGLRLVMEAVLQAPSFIYRTELGQHVASEGEPVTLTPFEIASALSFLMTESVPDDTLWQKALDGTLSDPAVLAAEADRLMALPEVRAVLTKKASYWLNLESLPRKIRDPDLFPEFTEELRASLYASVQTFLSETLWNGHFGDLFSSSTVYADARIADVYGLAEAPEGELIALDVPERSAGILTQPGFLAAANKWNDRGDPIHRGLYVYDAFVCGAKLPAPPANAFEEGAKLAGTEREKVALRAAMPTCNACHALFDPIGLTFERYDAMGRYSEHRYTEIDPVTGITSWKESEAPIDASSELSPGLGAGFGGPVDGLAGLAEKLHAASERVARCAAKELAQFALGYNPEARNACELAEVKDAFARTGSFPELFRALVTSPAFITRDALSE